MPSNRRNRSTKSGADPQPGTDASAKITEITPSNRRNRSTKSGADPQPGTDASAKINEITQTINDLEENDPDRVRKVLAKLRELFPEHFDFSTVGDDVIKNILRVFNFDTKGKTNTLVKKLKQIIHFKLSEVEGKSLEELKKKNVPKDQLVMYHLEKRGYLLDDVNNTNKAALAGIIKEAMEDDKEYFLHLSCDEIKTKVEEKIGHIHKNTRQTKRETLVINLQQAMGNYEDKSDEWVFDKDTTEIQLRVELLRLDDNAYVTSMTKKGLQREIIRLRNQQVPPPSAAKSTLEEEEEVDQPHPNASCITPARPNQDLHQRNQVATSSLDKAVRALLTSTQAQHQTNQAQHQTNQAQHQTNQAQHQTNQAQHQTNQALHQTVQAQQETNVLVRRNLDQHGKQIADLQQNQNAQGATIVQHDQRIKATEAEVATQKKEMATQKKELDLLQHLFCTARKEMKASKGLPGRNSDPLQRRDNIFDTPPTLTIGTDIETTTNGNAQNDNIGVASKGNEIRVLFDSPANSVPDVTAVVSEEQNMSSDFEQNDDSADVNTLSPLFDSPVKALSPEYGLSKETPQEVISPRDREEKLDGRQGDSGGITKIIGETGINSVVSNTAAATATAAVGTDQGDAAANADASSNLVKGSREFAETNKTISATEAKDDGGGEEKRATDRLTDVAKLLLDEGSNESQILEALTDLDSVLSIGHDNNNKYATLGFEIKGLIDRLEQLNTDGSDEVSNKSADILTNYFQGVEVEVNETESTETSLGHDAVDFDATQAQYDNKGRRPELKLQEAEVCVFDKEKQEWNYCLGSYTYKNSSGELKAHKVRGELSISDKTLTVRNISNKAILFCATVAAGLEYQEIQGRPTVFATTEEDPIPKLYLFDVAENDRNDLRTAIQALAEG